MTLIKPPDIDKRTTDEVAEQTRQLMCAFLAWNKTADGGEAGIALTKIFAHLCSLVIDRINRAPEKNFLAFLDLLGNTLTPASPSKVPLSFTLTSSAAEGVLLPSGTRLFAQPPAGVAEPIYFETEENLWLTTLELKCFLSSEDSTTYRALTTLINNESPTSPALFENQNQTYYFGFSLAEPKKLPIGLPVVLYFDIESPFYDPDNHADANQLLAWEYYSNSTNKWESLYVEDQTQLLTASGKIVFEVPSDFSSRKLTTIETDKPYYWLRVKMKPTPNNSHPVHLKWLAINTVTALQVASVHDEILGSSTGNPTQTFKSFRTPVQPGQRLEIREKIATTVNKQTSQETWQHWQEVPDFYTSKASDRHYILDHDSGTVTFGNGQNGMIPPLGVRNIIMKSYRYGGGQQGNVPAGAITSFWSPLSGVDKVTNYRAAVAGSDTETYESLLERAPKTLRHRNHAVTETDYEDLAKMASTEVAVARCFPLIDLAATPYKEKVKHTDEKLDNTDEKLGAGKVSIIIVPKTNDTKPMPTLVLIQRVKDYITPLAPATALLSVVGPLYLKVNTTIHIRLRSKQLEKDVEKKLQTLLAEFLHPLTGRNGVGWAFGRKPHASDFYFLLNTVDDIDYVESVDIKLVNPQESQTETTIEETARFLIYSGEHQIITNDLGG